MLLAASDSFVTPVLVALIGACGLIVVAVMGRVDRARLSRLEDDVDDCRKQKRRMKRALLRLGVDPDDPMFDDDE